MSLPLPTLLERAETALADIVRCCPPDHTQQINALLKQAPLKQALLKALTLSVYLQQLLQGSPQKLLALLQHPYLLKDVADHYFTQQMQEWQISSDQELDSALRLQRQLEMARFIVHLASQISSPQQLMLELSCFADACLAKALQWHHQQLVRKHGQPIGRETGKPQSLVILGMGKLGANELNLSSDIDLIFAYPEAGQTDGEKSLDNQQFFTRLGQQLIKTMDKVNAEGFVFRMDMRLRPYGQSGPLVQSFNACELYYAKQGREWERYAMIKARCVAGDQQAGAELLQRLRPFVYRKYTDFSAVQALREMKLLIQREVRQSGKQDDVKLGAGGIREIEFIIQSYQLIYGGRDTDLQQRNAMQVLHLLAEKNYLSAQVADRLEQAYYFLRDTEHAIQAIYDQQSHSLPPDDNDKLRIAYVLGYETIDDFLAQLEQHRQYVGQEFDDVVDISAEDDQQDDQEWRHIWLEQAPYFSESLQRQGFNEDEVERLNRLRQDPRVQRLETLALERFQLFMPKLLKELALTQDRGNVVEGLILLVEAVLRRTIYLVLLIENPRALKRLIKVATASPWIVKQLAQYPVLLDELLHGQGLGKVPQVSDLRESLREQGLRLALEDQEAHMQMLRYFRLAHHLHIVAAESSGKLSLMKVSDYLSFLAEAILEYVLQLAWQQAVQKYGCPTRNGEASEQADFLIVAYGKLGGLELSHQSDLDLIFLHDADQEGMTDGVKPIANTMFYTRLGQSIIHQLTTRTVLGQLYAVDTRLRPSGESGLLVNSIDYFARYQMQQAWSWEHQALVRGRAVAGPEALVKRFDNIRKNILTLPRERGQLQDDVIEMRDKMYQHLAPSYIKQADAEKFDLKHSRGGIVDLEFMVQFAVLAWSHNYPAIAHFSDNIRILENLSEAGLLQAETAQQLIDIYRFYRSQVHKLALRHEKSEVSIETVEQERRFVGQMWQQLLEEEINTQ